MKTFSKQKHKKTGMTFVGVMAVMTFLITLPFSGYAEPLSPPFEPGERLTYKLKWNKVIIGEVIVDVLSDMIISGANARHFYMTGRTAPFADTFYEYRVQADGYALPDMSRSVFYTAHDISRKVHETVTVHFDLAENQLRYSSEKLKKGKIEKKNKTVSTLSDTFDILSVFYHLRNQVRILGDKKEIRVSATNGRKVLNGKVYVIGNETIEVRGHGLKETVHLQLDGKGLKDIHSIRKKDDIVDIWVSRDEKCIPLLIKGKAKFGKVAAELVTIEKNDLTRLPMMQ